MQLHIRGQETHIIECQNDDTIAVIKVRFHFYF
jgi:hypothetical protein